MEIKKSPILVTGVARSGTSMTAGVINLCGAFGGKMSPGNRNNQKGMFENQCIRNTVVKPYLRSMGMDAKGQYPLPNPSQIQPYTDLKQRIHDIMLREGYDGGEWMYKGAKMCLIWSIWKAAFPRSKWIIVRRDDAGIINSCFRTGFMNAFKNQSTQRAVGASSQREGWMWWIRQHEKRFEEMIAAGMKCKVFRPETLVNGDYTKAKEMIEWLGLEWNEEKVKGFIEPKLWKSKKKGIR